MHFLLIFYGLIFNILPDFFLTIYTYLYIIINFWMAKSKYDCALKIVYMHCNVFLRL